MARIAVLMFLVALLVTLPARAGAADSEVPQPTGSLITVFGSKVQHPGGDIGMQGAMSRHRKLLSHNRIQQRCRRIYSRWCR
jgi:hypothetical protein